MKKTILAIGSALLLASFSVVSAGEKVTLCHATSSEKNPFVLITVSVNAADKHVASGDFVAPGSTKESCTLPPPPPPPTN